MFTTRRWLVGLAILLLTALVSAFLTLYLTLLAFEHGFGLQWEPKVGATLGYRPTLNRVREEAYDSTGDGKLDQWTVYIREGEPFECNYLLDDLEGDGSPNACIVGIGREGAERFVVRMRDSCDDGHATQLSVGVAGLREGEFYNYQDIDGDGLFDKLSRTQKGEPAASYVLMDMSWVRAGSADPPAVDRMWIRGPDNTREKVIFEDGEWRRTGEREPWQRGHEPGPAVGPSDSPSPPPDAIAE